MSLFLRAEEDYRAKRITDYLNLVDRIIKEQVEKLSGHLLKPVRKLSSTLKASREQFAPESLFDHAIIQE